MKRKPAALFLAQVVRYSSNISYSFFENSIRLAPAMTQSGRNKTGRREPQELPPACSFLSYSCRMASSALILVARMAGHRPLSTPTRVEKPRPSSTSQGGIMEMAALPPSMP